MNDFLQPGILEVFNNQRFTKSGLLRFNKRIVDWKTIGLEKVVMELNFWSKDF